MLLRILHRTRYRYHGSIDMAQLLLDHTTAPHAVGRGGRKAHRLVVKELGSDTEPPSPESLIHG